LPKKYCKLNIHIHCHSCFLYHHPPCSHPPRHWTILLHQSKEITTSNI
jgi:hypothetical protein